MHNGILALSKLKPIADMSNVAQMVQLLFNRLENIVEKGENAGYQHFLLFPECFQKAFSSSASKVIIAWLSVKAPFYRLLLLI